MSEIAASLIDAGDNVFKRISEINPTLHPFDIAFETIRDRDEAKLFLVGFTNWVMEHWDSPDLSEGLTTPLGIVSNQFGWSALSLISNPDFDAITETWMEAFSQLELEQEVPTS